MKMIITSLPVFDKDHPTDQKNYIDRPFAQGTPLNWRDDTTGVMPAAVMAYLNQTPTDDQLQLVIAYIQHHIHAPCFLEKSPFHTANADPETSFEPEIKALRETSLKLKTLKDINKYINQALEIALDPL